jgi:hypothetical protein
MPVGYQHIHAPLKYPIDSGMFEESYAWNHQKLSTLFSTAVDNFNHIKNSNLYISKRYGMLYFRGVEVIRADGIFQGKSYRASH